MELQTISQVSKEYGISTRMLRYYEQIGLIESQRKEDYSYRVYNEKNLRRLQQIVILRKLQIPVKKICSILASPDAAEAIDVFKKSIRELDSEITALSTIKSILEKFVAELEEISNISLTLDFLSEDSVLKMVGSLSLVQKNVKEKFTMNDFNDLDKASKRLSKLQNVRIIYLPPMTVATYTYMDRKDPHEKTREVITKFVKDNGLLNIKPDARHFALDYPMFNFDPPLGHERWVTIPDDMEVPLPLVKKKFLGGMYVACVQGEHDTALGLQDWINESEEYQCEVNANRVEPHTPGLSWVLEEELNFVHNMQNLDSKATNHIPLQIDYLFSIKPIVHVEEVVTEIADSVEKCGLKVQLITKNKIKIYGFSQFGKSRSGDIWQDIKADGRLDIIQKYRKPGGSIVSLGSMDCGCHGQDGSRTTIGLFESDITDIEAFETHVNHIHQLDASLWLRFEKTEGIDYNWMEMLPKMGYKWNALISGNFEEYIDGVIPLMDEKDKLNSKRISYGWHSVLPQ